MEVIDIGLTDLEPVSFSLQDNGPSSSAKPSVNFGPGIELLMNDKVKSGSGSTNVDLGDLDKLANELNELSGETPKSTSGETRTLGGFAANLFNFGGGSNTPSTSSHTIHLDNDTDSRVGQATAETADNTKTWDGFGKINDVPMASSAPRLSDREKRRKKRAMLKKMEEWYEKGHTKSNTHLNMDSPYEEVEDEYETIMDEKRKKDSIKLQGWWFMTFVNSIEYGNAVFDPFGLNLDGWGEQISEDIDSYEEIFSELHEKYKGGKLSPEISLLLRLGFSAAVVNITNKALSTATPGFNDVIRQSPELMKMFSNATVDSMNQSSPGFGFVNSVLHPEERNNTTFGPPPPAMETKNQPPPQRPGMNFTQNPGSRPDIAMGRGAMYKEPGIDVNNNFENVRTQERTARQAPPPDYSNTLQGPRSEGLGQSHGLRPEMRGPQDLNGLLSGLKTREVNIHTPTQSNTENDSMVSITSLNDSQHNKMPKSSNRRKQRSDKNIVSLDI
jgi:Family of unknown function (DUF5767)